MTRTRIFGALVVCAAVLVLAACQQRPRGKYRSHVRLPTGEEWTEQADFRPDGTCYFGHPPNYIAESKWMRNGQVITVSGNGDVLVRLKFDGKNLVLVQGDTFHSRFVPQDQ